ncbi:MAG: hypothetical protein KDC79_11250 [Cyclobacteriaceae bacterium]|nr:hypothetical protein [Cyclobacteriaceae bacterium]
MIEFLTDIGIAGFLFFFIKGLLWIVLFVLVYLGVIDKEKAKAIKNKLTFWKKSKNTQE